MQATGTIRVEGFEYEIDNYSPSQEFDEAGGSVVLRGHVGETAVTATVSAANLQQALGRALIVLLETRPDPAVSAVSVTGYIDSEVGTFMQVDRVETR
jgi:hypothetical protein